MYVRRKVFSYSEPEEQLYSVTMTEDEYYLFSEFMDAYDEYLFSSLGGYDVSLMEAKKAAGKDVVDIHEWAKTKEGQEWLKKHGTVSKEATGRLSQSNGAKTTKKNGVELVGDKKAGQGRKGRLGKSNLVFDLQDRNAAFNSSEGKLQQKVIEQEIAMREAAEKAAADSQRAAAAARAEGLAAGRNQGAKIARAAKQAGYEAGMNNAGFRQAFKNAGRYKKAGIVTAGLGLAGSGAYGSYKALNR
jgi:hypothetical protein